MPDDDQQDWQRGPQVEFIRAVQQEQVSANQAEMNASLRALQITEAQRQATIARKQAEALNRYRPPRRRATPLPPPSLVIGEAPLPLATPTQGIVNFNEQWDEARAQWAEARDGARVEGTRDRDQAKTREEARMLLRDALNAGVSSGLFSQERALAIVALTQINNQPFPAEEAKQNVRLAFKVAAEAGAIRGRVGGLAWKLVQDSLNGEPDLELPADAERYEELLYDALILRPCHLPEHEGWHTLQTICAAQRVRVSDVLLESLDLSPRLLPRVAHTDALGNPLECCENEATQRWLSTGLTESAPET